MLMILHGGLRSSMEAHEAPWRLMELHRGPWNVSNLMFPSFRKSLEVGFRGGGEKKLGGIPHTIKEAG